MTNETQEQFDMVTKPVKEHEWLKHLLGEWKVESEMDMPDGSKMHTTGTASVKSLGGLWAYTEGRDKMPDGTELVSYFSLGYDLTFKEYRGGMVMSASSHLWKYTGKLSADGKTMTLDCEGPNMQKDGETAMYRDTIELIDENTRVTTNMGQDETGEWQTFATSRYTRA